MNEGKTEDKRSGGKIGLATCRFKGIKRTAANCPFRISVLNSSSSSRMTLSSLLVCCVYSSFFLVSFLSLFLFIRSLRMNAVYRSIQNDHFLLFVFDFIFSILLVTFCIPYHLHILIVSHPLSYF